MKLVWDATGEKHYETGVSNGVLFPTDGAGGYAAGVVWNGLTAVNESPSGAEATSLYADNIKYVNIQSAEEFAATIEAYTYPKEFEECDGSREIADGVTIGQQSRKGFGLSYQTKIGNDTEGSEFGTKIHIVYGLMAAPSEKNYQTVNDSPEAITFSWEAKATPVPVEGFKPTASLVIDSRTVSKAGWDAVVNKLYGDASNTSALPTPDEIKALVTSN